jgi:hypothetical protein
LLPPIPHFEMGGLRGAPFHSRITRMKGKNMKQTLLIGFLIATLLTACGAVPAAQPTLDIDAIIAGTLTAQPTATMLPTDTATPLPSATPTATVTPPPSLTPTPKPSKTSKPKVVIGCFTPNGTAGRTAEFKLENFGGEKSTVYINGISRNGNHPIYCTYIVKQGLPISLTLMWGDYDYRIERGSTTRFGTFFINDDDKATMRIFKDKIQIGPFE